MKFKLSIKLDENDYLEFNKFYAIYSPYRDKKMDTFRIALSVILGVLSLIMLIGNAFSPFAFLDILPYVLLIISMNVFWKKILSWFIKQQIKNLKNKGGLPYAENSVMEFYDDRFNESTHNSKTENLYDTVERICIWKNAYIYIHVNTVGAYIIPMSVFKSDEQSREFIAFMEDKCKTVESFS